MLFVGTAHSLQPRERIAFGKYSFVVPNLHFVLPKFFCCESHDGVPGIGQKAPPKDQQFLLTEAPAPWAAKVGYFTTLITIDLLFHKKDIFHLFKLAP